jgi:hypothetical protein
MAAQGVAKHNGLVVGMYLLRGFWEYAKGYHDLEEMLSVGSAYHKNEDLHNIHL